ncbi:hypothetical protein HDV00_003022 [Rhizophlyctis rosea]|nr:hypothetical protein HDV00_003022 [Rhizophlyctis rosea]
MIRTGTHLSWRCTVTLASRSPLIQCRTTTPLTPSIRNNSTFIPTFLNLSPPETIEIYNTVNRKTRKPQPFQIPPTWESDEADPAILVRNCLRLKLYEKLPAYYQRFRARGALSGLTAEEFTEVISRHLAGKQGSAEEALRVREDMIAAGYQPSLETEVSLVAALRQEEGSGLAIRYLRALQANKPELFTPSLELYHTLLESLSKAGKHHEVVAFIERMIKVGNKPTAKTYEYLVGGLGSIGRDGDAVAAHKRMISQGIEPTVGNYTALVNTFALQGKVSQATKYFYEIEKRGMKADTAAWTALIRAQGDKGRAVEVYKEMCAARVRVSPECVALMIEAFGKAQDATSARRFLHKNELRETQPRSIEMYTAVVNAHLRVKENALAWTLLTGVKEDGLEFDHKFLLPLALDCAGRLDYFKGMLKLTELTEVDAAILQARLAATYLLSKPSSPDFAITFLTAIPTDILPESHAIDASATLIHAYALKNDAAQAKTAFDKAKSKYLAAKLGGHYSYLVQAYANAGDVEAMLASLEEAKGSGWVGKGGDYEVVVRALQGKGDEAGVEKVVRQLVESGVVPSKDSTPSVFAAAEKILGPDAWMTGLGLEERAAVKEPVAEQPTP